MLNQNDLWNQVFKFSRARFNSINDFKSKCQEEDSSSSLTDLGMKPGGPTTDNRVVSCSMSVECDDNEHDDYEQMWKDAMSSTDISTEKNSSTDLRPKIEIVSFGSNPPGANTLTEANSFPTCSKVVPLQNLMDVEEEEAGEGKSREISKAESMLLEAMEMRSLEEFPRPIHTQNITT